jgi:S-adenosylmethionine:tRNA ribosyltransferase-isomerase
MKRSDFHFDLPAELVAQQPLAERSGSRLLVADPRDGSLRDASFRDLPGLLRTGDLLVFNDTRVIPARIHGRKDSGGDVEILLERITGSHTVLAQVRASKALRAGRSITLADGTIVRVLGREGDFEALRFESPDPLEAILARVGHVPLPPYIRRADQPGDLERYQTVYASRAGAVAAPTAGLHFDSPLLDRLRDTGVDFGYLTLHVGAGTFQPMRCEEIGDHVMHSEQLEVGAGLVEQINAARARGGRVVAVGTTVVRALETASQGGSLQPFAGETRIFIVPGHRFTSVDALLTNFHLPESTLLMLVSAFAGRDFVLDAYRHAVAQGYRFFSYGDAMMLFAAHVEIG